MQFEPWRRLIDIKVKQDVVLFINGLLVIFFVAWYAFSNRKPRPPAKLRLRGENEGLLTKVKGEIDDSVPHRKLESLNVMFIYNGHSWDAYEVLGLRPGSSLNEIRDVFNRQIQSASPDSHEFLRAALEAVLKDFKKRGL